MTTKDNYLAEEWFTLLKAPMMVGYAVIGASPSGMIGFVKEMKAVADAVVEAGQGAPAGSLVGEVAADIKARAMGEREAIAVEKVSVTDLKGKALETCNRAAQILKSKAAPDEADAYKQWLLAIGHRVAEAANEGGFLGFGGRKVNEAETAALNEIAAALGTEARRTTATNPGK